MSVPRDHRMGELEAPSIRRLEFREDPEKHVVLLSVVVEPRETFLRSLARSIMASGGSNAFLFVHGYNVTFADAARRTAQMAYDLRFDGAPVFYSWPSRGLTTAYTVDEQNVEWAERNLRGFLGDFFVESQARNVYLIAHSMGNRALTRALASVVEQRPDVRSRLRQVVLTAPDIDADVFRRDIAPALIAKGAPITLYASSGDVALAASRRVHGAPRAGDSGRGLVLLNGIDTIEASDVDTSLLGHSYFAETRSVLSDMFYLFRGMAPDTRFGLEQTDSNGLRYWRFKR